MTKNTRVKKRRKIKRRFIFLNILAVVLIVFGIRYMDIAGDRYDMHSFTYFTDEAGPDFNDTEVAAEPEGVVRVESLELSDEQELIIKLSSVKKGSADITITTYDEEGKPNRIKSSHVDVTMTGAIIDHRDYYTNFSGYEVVTWLFLGYIAAVLVVMLYSFYECYKKSDYSYSMVAYGGISLFLAVLLAIIVYKWMNNVVGSFSALVSLLTETGEWFLVLMLPVMLVMAVALSVSNIWLLRHEGFRPVNALGIAISVVWLLALGFSLNYRLFHIILLENTTLIWHIRNIMSFVVTYFECMLLSTSACAFISTRHTPPLDRDYIIILGCAIRRDGTLTPLLRGRVDSALSFEKKQFEETGKHARFVPSGGQGSDEIISEGEAMERYLIEQGVEPERIVREDKSVNTFQNMQFSRDRIMDDTDDFEEQKIAFSTTNYHIFRGYILADKNGFKAQGISAKTKWYFFPNAFIREFIGLLFDQKIRHLLIVALIAVIVIGVAHIL